MAVAVKDNDLREVERGNALKTGSIDSELVGVRSALVVGVNAAITTEMVLSGSGIEEVG